MVQIGNLFPHAWSSLKPDEIKINKVQILHFYLFIYLAISI